MPSILEAHRWFLKTAGLSFPHIHQRSLELRRQPAPSITVCRRPQLAVTLPVSLAVGGSMATQSTDAFRNSAEHGLLFGRLTIRDGTAFGFGHKHSEH
jgi:hypothetical protein